MSKFKVGDRVVVLRGIFGLPSLGAVLLVNAGDNIILVKLDNFIGGHNGVVGGVSDKNDCLFFTEKEIELLEVYNSPLYKLLSE